MYFVVAIGVTSLMSAKNVAELKNTTANNESLVELTTVRYFDPIIPITSSCGYTEFIDLAGSSIECLEVELVRMEEECAAPFEDWGYC